jgi:phage FluMu protein Com
MEGKGIYKKCNDCGNTAKGTGIWRCNLCNHIFCEACQNTAGDWFQGPRCPKCKKLLLEAIGDRNYREMGKIG